MSPLERDYERVSDMAATLAGWSLAAGLVLISVLPACVVLAMLALGR